MDPTREGTAKLHKGLLGDSMEDCNPNSIFGVILEELDWQMSKTTRMNQEICKGVCSWTKGGGVPFAKSGEIL